jgi:anti-sigma-K factor RskA
MTPHDDAHLLSGAYALDALTAEEAAALEAAMQESEELRGEVVGLTDTAVVLGLSVPPAAPPAALRGRLLEAIETLPQEAAPAGVTAEAETVPTPMPNGVHVPPRRPRRRRGRMAALLAAAAAAVLIFSGGFLLQRTLLEPQGEFSRVTQAADVHIADATVTGGGTAKVYWSRSEHRTAVVLIGVETPSDRVLQLWSIRGDTVTSAGLYEPQGGDRYALLSGTPARGEQLAVSVEPAGGSPQPTTKPIVVVPLQA